MFRSGRRFAAPVLRDSAPLHSTMVSPALILVAHAVLTTSAVASHDEITQQSTPSQSQSQPQQSTKQCRDRFLEPFSSDSIWNTAIGSSAVFHPADLFAPGDSRGIPGNFHNDQDFIVRVTSSDPITEWINQGDWGADDHCAIQHPQGRYSVQCFGMA